MYLNTTPDTEEEINPEEDARLRQTVATTNVGCAKTAIQSAVTWALLVLNQDWGQEGRRLMREFGMLSSQNGEAPMRSNAHSTDFGNPLY